MRPLASLVAGVLLCGSAASPRAAPLIEEMRSVTVRLDGQTVRVPVLVDRPADAARHPLLLLLHGRGVDADANRRLGRAEFPAAARWFVERGYAVLTPTRAGYGIAGGADREDTGPCEAKAPLPALWRAAREMDAVLADARTASWADGTTRVLIGDSFGGLVALATAAVTEPAPRAVLAIGAGDGGDSLQHVDAPCAPSRTAAAFAALGAKARAPALFLYSRNDRLWGPDWPQRWWGAWHAAGGRGELVWLPADKNNGHYIFSRNAPAWQAPVGRYLGALGLPGFSS